jgi:hypothetical protein
MSRKKLSFIAFSVLLLVSLACNIGNSAEQSPTQPTQAVEQPSDDLQPAEGQAEQQTEPQAEPPPAEVIVVTATPAPTTIPSEPIGLWQGLSSLNSYRLTIRLVNNGPTEQDLSQSTILIEVGSDGDSSHTHYETVMSSSDDPEVSTSISDQYRVGSRTCDVSDGEATITDNDPMVQEMIDAWFKMIDLLPMVNDPAYLGEEMLNGVMTNHFSFDVEGLGVESGAEVVYSNGEYWLAQDGQYLVKYSVVMETRNGPADDPNTQKVHSEFNIETTDINQEIVITLPSNCQ